ncbi:MAG: hypothetical protein ACRDXF_12640, partial [Acidimicrobiia bacterium]
ITALTLEDGRFPMVSCSRLEEIVCVSTSGFPTSRQTKRQICNGGELHPSGDDEGLTDCNPNA